MAIDILKKINGDNTVTQLKCKTVTKPKSIIDKVNELRAEFKKNVFPNAKASEIVGNGFHHPKRIVFRFEDGSERVITIEWVRTIIGKNNTVKIAQNHGNNKGENTTGNIIGYKLLD